MRRLYLLIYLGFVAVAALCVVVAGLTAALVVDEEHDISPLLKAGPEYVSKLLPPAGAPPADVARALDDHAARMQLDLTLHDASGALVASTGEPIGGDQLDDPDAGWIHGRRGPGIRMRLPDGRWLSGIGNAAWQRKRSHLHMLLLLVLLAFMALACYPIARRITRRLETLQVSVERWGKGDLTARAVVGGRDEVSLLARRFNAAADRIEALVAAQRRMLASASHELRSPLARVRMAIELLAEEQTEPERRRELEAEAARDVEELDGLIDDLLLVGRIRGGGAEEPREAVELAAIVAEEAARASSQVATDEVESAVVHGDGRALRRMVRNLVDNAIRHGGGEAVSVSLGAVEGGRVLLAVADRGPGVPEGERVRIFEPFYRPPGHRESVGGVGLGLALVREIAEHHGGEARYRPREGGGSVFEVELPPAGARDAVAAR